MIFASGLVQGNRLRQRFCVQEGPWRMSMGGQGWKQDGQGLKWGQSQGQSHRELSGWPLREAPP